MIEIECVLQCKNLYKVGIRAEKYEHKGTSIGYSSQGPTGLLTGAKKERR